MPTALPTTARLARAASLVDRLETIGQEPDGTYEGVVAVVDRSATLWMAGRFEDAARSPSPGSTQSTRYGWDVRTGWAFRNHLADCLIELGRYDDAMRSRNKCSTTGSRSPANGRSRI